MAISLKHLFTNPKGDPTDATLVRPSNWNAEHVITAAANILLGCVTAGAVAEIPCTAYARTLLAAADLSSIIAALGCGVFETGDAKFTLRATASAGWILADDGSIGDGTSGASTRANADTWPLYQVLYALPDAYAPVSGGRSGSGAAADFAAHKTIGLTKILGRALAAAGSGSGLTARSLGATVGEETHALLAAELPPHTHAGTTGNDSPDHSHSTVGTATGGVGTAPTEITFDAGAGAVSGAQGHGSGTGGASVRHTHTFTTDNGPGASTAHQNMQPTSFLNVMVKL